MGDKQAMDGVVLGSRNLRAVEGNSGLMFNLDSCEEVENERVVALGKKQSERRSLATGNDVEHERLLRTSKGNYIIHRTNDYESTAASPEKFRHVSVREAMAWMSLNQHKIPEQMERDLLEETIL